MESVMLRMDEPTSVLGLKWITASDEFTYIVKGEKIDGKLTKRSILSTIGQLYDPIGFLSPVLVRAKLLLQSIWKEQLDWGQLVLEQIIVQWEDIWSKIKEIEQIKIPRWIQTIGAAHIRANLWRRNVCACAHCRWE